MYLDAVNFLLMLADASLFREKLTLAVTSSTRNLVFSVNFFEWINYSYIAENESVLLCLTLVAHNKPDFASAKASNTFSIVSSTVHKSRLKAIL